MDIFVLTSIREGLPVSLIEAMAARRPVVASNIGSVRDLVGHGQNGLVVPARDAAAFAAAIGQLIDSPELRRKLGDAGRQTVEASFSLPAVIRAYENLYRSAVMKIHVRN
jgi:glycosyltransferase involved in cell wall biosynthesis